MRVPHLRLAALALASGVALGGCSYNGLYGGLEAGYGNYGYGAYNDYGYYDPYYYGGFGRPYGGLGGYYGGYPYWGWYNGFYYPGTGSWVYDTHRRRHPITEEQRQYWAEKFARFRNSGTTSTTGTTATSNSAITPRENWSGFNRGRHRSSDSTITTSNRGSDRVRGSSSSSNRSSSSSSSSSTSRSSGDSFKGRHFPSGRNKD